MEIEGMELTTNKLIAVLKSRKFWASVLGLLAVFGVSMFADIDSDKLIDAIMVIVAAFVGSTALEDGLSRRDVLLPEIEAEDIQ